MIRMRSTETAGCGGRIKRKCDFTGRDSENILSPVYDLERLITKITYQFGKSEGSDWHLKVLWTCCHRSDIFWRKCKSASAAGDLSKIWIALEDLCAILMTKCDLRKNHRLLCRTAKSIREGYNEEVDQSAKSQDRMEKTWLAEAGSRRTGKDRD